MDAKRMPPDTSESDAHEVDGDASDANGADGLGTNPISDRIRAGMHAELTPRRAELRRLADAARLIIERLVATDAPDDVIARATADLEAAAARFAGYRQGSLYGFAETANAGDLKAMFDHSPFIGIANPLAPPMTVEAVDGCVRAKVMFGSAYEGPPGCVHGGYVAGAFDELLGATQSLSGAPGMTGTLSVRYENPTPLHTELRLVGELARIERRKIFVVGRMFAGDTMTASAEGIFISMKPDQFTNLAAVRDARQAQREVSGKHADGDGGTPTRSSG
jgi:acyl-coenzyme A thioesterase PaaI-like protein